MITSPEMVTITAHVDSLNTAQLLFAGSQVAALANPVQFGQTLSYTFNAAQMGNGTYRVEEVEQTVGLKSLVQTAWATITVAIPHSSAASSGSGSPGSSGGSGGSSSPGAHSGAVSGGSGGSGNRGGGGSPAGNGSANAPAALGYSGPVSGGNGFGSTYSRLLALSGSSSLVLPDVAPQNGFQLPKAAKETRLASSPSRASSLTAATWLVGVALALIMLLTAAHTSAWARKRRLLNAKRPVLDAVGAIAGGGDTAASAAPDAPDAQDAQDAPGERGGRHRGRRGRRDGDAD
jgi:hypothetical protein